MDLNKNNGTVILGSGWRCCDRDRCCNRSTRAGLCRYCCGDSRLHLEGERRLVDAEDLPLDYRSWSCRR